VITFSGKKKDWIASEEKFLSKSKHRGFKEILLGKLVVPISTDILDPAIDQDKVKISLQERNQQGYTDVWIKVRESLHSTLDYDDGKNETASKNMRRNEYAPKTVPSLAKLESLYGSKLKKNFDPNVFIIYLKDLRSTMEDMKFVMTENQFILHVVNNLMEDYMNQVESLERRIGSKTDTIDIEDIGEELNLKFERSRTGARKAPMTMMKSMLCLPVVANHAVNATIVASLVTSLQIATQRAKVIILIKDKEQEEEVKSSKETVFIAKSLDTKPLLTAARKRRMLVPIKPQQQSEMEKMT
jgi:hypothetical protein